MSQHPNTRVLATALVLGVVGDALLHGHRWGLNVEVWLGLVLAATVWTARWSRQPLPRVTRIFLLLAFVYGMGFVLWTSTSLRAFDALAVVGCLFLAVACRGSLTYWQVTPERMATVLNGAVDLSSRAPFRVIAHATTELRASDTKSTAKSVGRVLLLAVPLLIVFGKLFALADADFRHLFDFLPEINPEWIVAHSSLSLVIAALAVAVCVHFFQEPSSAAGTDISRKVRVRPIEATIVMVLVNALFLVFVALQFEHFFRGNLSVQQTPGLTYSDYARGGFFELLIVAGITTAQLLLINFLLGNTSKRAKRPVHLLFAVQVAQTFVVLASAVHRLVLYVSAYGLTVARVWGVVGIVWVAFALAWLVWTSLAARPGRFLGGVVTAGLVLLFGLNLMPPEVTAARVNLSTTLVKGALDLEYLVALGPDAAPIILRDTEGLNQPTRRYVTSSLGRKDWRPRPESALSWNWSRYRARKAIAAATAEQEGGVR